MADLFDMMGGGEGPAGPRRPSAPPRTAAAEGPRPLAEAMRPENLAEVIGQDHVVGPDGALTRMLSEGSLGSIVFWGPPGVGKTTISRLLAGESDREFVALSAIFTGVAELRKIFEAARDARRMGRGTLLFVDEIHRFNKAQQDAFLPHMEDGTIVLVGATTENPSFELNAALLSRAQVLTLRRLDEVALEAMLVRIEVKLDRRLPLDPAARAALVGMADGDGRTLVNLVEQILPHQGEDLSTAELEGRVTRRAAHYDRKGDGHYGLASALQKSIRASDPDAALYWLARMLKAGEDPRFLARRLTRIAVEDVGLADPRAQELCLAAWQSYERLGSPEGELALGQATLYLAMAPKSNGAYRAFNAAMDLAARTGSIAPPKHLLNAPTKWMEEEGYGEGYIYDHAVEGGSSGQDCFPPEVGRHTLYDPPRRGREVSFADRMAEFRSARSPTAI